MNESLPSIVITGLGTISPLGNSVTSLWQHLSQGRSGITRLPEIFNSLPTKVAGQAREFTGDIQQFGPLEKKLQRSIKKGLKLMCREIQMGVAAAQLAVNAAGVIPDESQPQDGYDNRRVGVLFGCDHILSIPEEFTDGVRACLDDDGQFHFERWAEKGLGKVDPLWLLKYLPNMPACHFAIYHDLQGPNNSLTVREASSNMAISESLCTLARGGADVMIVGGTGSRVHTSRSVHMSLQEEVAIGSGEPGSACRPFASDRGGMVLGEGAGALVMETAAYAKARGAKVLARVVAGASSTVASHHGVADFRQAFANVLRSLLQQAEMTVDQIGHIHAHGLGTRTCDQQEAEAIQQVCGDKVPVVAAKSYMGNLGAGGGMVETVASILAMQEGHLFASLNGDHLDPACPINLVTTNDVPAGDNFINLNITPQGQASGVLICRA